MKRTHENKNVQKHCSLWAWWAASLHAQFLH